MITIINALTFTTGSVLGILIGYLIEHNLARSRGIEAIRIVEFNKGAAEFRATFVDIKYAYRQAIATPSSDDQGYFLIRKIHTDSVNLALEKAKILFEPYLTRDELIGFNAAWENYIEWPRHFQNNHDNKEKTSEMLRHLEALLKYAKPK